MCPRKGLSAFRRQALFACCAALGLWMAHCMAIPTLPLFVETCPTAARSKNGSNVCGAGKPEASYSQGKTPVSNLCDGNTDTAWGDWQSKGSVKPEPWVSWTFDEAKTLDYDLPGSLNIETQAYPRRSRSRSRRMVTSSRPRRASPVMAMLASGFLLLIAAVAVFAIRCAAQ